MKKYLFPCILFLANNEIISMLALVIIACMVIWSIVATAEREGVVW